MEMLYPYSGQLSNPLMCIRDSELGVNVEYFCNEFMETSSRQVHDDDYLNIALFNAMYWEF